MKATTLQNRIKKHLTLKDGKTLAVKYECVIGMLINPVKLHPLSWHKNGRRVNLIGENLLFNLKDGLKKLGIDYKDGNDAPRGGRDGEFICLSKKGLQQTEDYRDNYNANI